MGLGDCLAAVYLSGGSQVVLRVLDVSRLEVRRAPWDIERQLPGLAQEFGDNGF